MYSMSTPTPSPTVSKITDGFITAIPNLIIAGLAIALAMWKAQAIADEKWKIVDEMRVELREVIKIVYTDHGQMGNRQK